MQSDPQEAVIEDIPQVWPESSLLMLIMFYKEWRGIGALLVVGIPCLNILSDWGIAAPEPIPVSTRLTTCFFPHLTYGYTSIFLSFQ